MAQVANRRSVITLYNDPNCPYSHMVRVVLAEKGISYDSIDISDGETPEDLKDLNPYNEVPTLVDRDLVLYEHQIVMEYLDERFPHPPLMPVDPVLRSQNRIMRYRIFRDWYSLLEKNTAENQKIIRDSLTVIAPIFEQKAFFMSDEFTLVDCALLPLLWRLPSLGIILPAQAQAILDYSEKMFERQAFQTSLSEIERTFRS
ncbi:Stringent starvation protein A [hydrothermal vent metagenome]|uniref:Stringent starvation protein A n=1 Tax=hydrothermal vent metagenome TaxID=652676 RepID=A0A3B1ALR4_9ZZZZ